MRPVSLLVLLLALGAGLSAQTGLGGTVASFRGFDQDGDGEPEIDDLELLGAAGDGKELVLVVVEQRLLGAGSEALRQALDRLIADLAAEGRRAALIGLRFRASTRHRDGRLLLALREFFRAVAAREGLAGAILVGRFPDALIVRSCNWRKKGDVELQLAAGKKKFSAVHYLRRVPEDVARRGDLVLADLDGRWEDLYVEEKTELEAIEAVFAGAIPPEGGDCVAIGRRTRSFTDFFQVADGRLEIAVGSEPGRERLVIHDEAADHECSAADRQRPNVIARPEILISRLDARGIALRPREDLTDAEGRGLIDERGRPRALVVAEGRKPPHWAKDLWVFDPELEGRLLVEYLDRNHRHRRSGPAEGWRPASFACDLGSGYRQVAAARADWREVVIARDDVAGRPGPGDFVDWLARPAILRTLRAHSDEWGSQLGKGDPAALDQRFTGPPVAWSPRGHGLVPSLAAAAGKGKVDWFLLQAFWRDPKLVAAPCFYLHTGCNAVSPPGARDRRHDHPAYGLRSGGESLLFFGGGLALIGRSKVFYDEPRGFAEVLRSNASFGETWRHYFDVESKAKSWAEVGGDIGRKRAYFWSLLGDWTLTLGR
ncbi:MAG: hypothetical protein H6807_06865 [Planctomycetes bacterium]|nr:hypothetical protein [Planctomycetota bacterium]